jgi:hypothetical protein
MARLKKTEIDLESLFREAENPSIDNLEYPISFDILSVSGIDEKNAVVIAIVEIEAEEYTGCPRETPYIVSSTSCRSESWKPPSASSSISARRPIQSCGRCSRRR